VDLILSTCLNHSTKHVLAIQNRFLFYWLIYSAALFNGSWRALFVFDGNLALLGSGRAWFVESRTQVAVNICICGSGFALNLSLYFAPDDGC
jgi:hypothetical protein